LEKQLVESKQDLDQTLAEKDEEISKKENRL
jgi:hypothetical protein